MTQLFHLPRAQLWLRLHASRAALHSYLEARRMWVCECRPWKKHDFFFPFLFVPFVAFTVFIFKSFLESQVTLGMKGQFRWQNETPLTFTAPVGLNPNQTRRRWALQRRVDGVTASLEIVHPFTSNVASVRLITNVPHVQEKPGRRSSSGGGGERGNISQVCLSGGSYQQLPVRELLPQAWCHWCRLTTQLQPSALGAAAV